MSPIKGVNFGGVQDKKFAPTPNQGNRCAYPNCDKGYGIPEGEPARFAHNDTTKWCHKSCADAWEARVRTGDLVAPVPEPDLGLCNAPNPGDYAVRCTREEHGNGHHIADGRSWYLAPAARHALEEKIAKQAAKGTSHPGFEMPGGVVPVPGADGAEVGGIGETVQERAAREAAASTQDVVDDSDVKAHVVVAEDQVIKVDVDIPPLMEQQLRAPATGPGNFEQPGGARVTVTDPETNVTTIVPMTEEVSGPDEPEPWPTETDEFKRFREDLQQTSSPRRPANPIPWEPVVIDTSVVVATAALTKLLIEHSLPLQDALLADLLAWKYS